MFSGPRIADSTFFWDLFLISKWLQASLWRFRHHGIHSNFKSQEHTKLNIWALNMENLIQPAGEHIAHRRSIFNDCILMFCHEDSQQEVEFLAATPPWGGRRGRSRQPTSTEIVWNSVSALGSGRWVVFFSLTSYVILFLFFPRQLRALFELTVQD